jgi:hypothetical protein
MITAKISVTPFAIMIGILLLNMPNKNHNNVPKANKRYMYKEIPEVSFVFIV